MNPELDWAIALLPAWVRWSPLVVQALLAGVATLVGATFGLLVAGRPWRKLDQAHWTERARAAHPLRVSSVFGLLAAPIGLGLLTAYTVGPVAAASPRTVGLTAASVALLVGLAARHRVERRIRPHAGSFASMSRGSLAILLLMLPHFIVAAAMFAALPATFDSRAAVVLGVGALAFVGASLGGAVHLGRLLGLFRRAPARVRVLVAGLAPRLGVEPRGLYEARSGTANAFALPLPKLLLVTERLPQLLDDAELGAILAHELGHLAEPRAVAVARMVPLSALYLVGASKPFVVAYGVTALYVGLGLLLLLILAARRLGRRMEQRADGIARTHEADPGAYARALELLYRDNAMPAVMPGRRAVHPHLYDRLVAAGMQPDVPRPAPPSRWLPVAAIAAGGLGGMLPWAGAHLAASQWAREARSAEAVLLGATAFDGGSAVRLSDIALARFQAADPATAAGLYLGASAIEPASVYYPANAALAWVAAGRCAAAEAAAARAADVAASRTDAQAAEAEHALVVQALDAVERCVER